MGIATWRSQEQPCTSGQFDRKKIEVCLRGCSTETTLVTFDDRLFRQVGESMNVRKTEYGGSVVTLEAAGS